MKTINRNLNPIIFILLLTLVLISSCGDDPEPITEFPWDTGPYIAYDDSTLIRMSDQNDTVAAMTLAWNYVQLGDTLKAADFIYNFNRFFDKAPIELNYLSGIVMSLARNDSLAIRYLKPLTDKKQIPQARQLIANSHVKLKDYKEALNIYKKMPDRKSLSIIDSIDMCKAYLDDTIAGINLAKRMLEQRNIGKAALFFSMFTSMSRGVSPPDWNYGCGEAYHIGNNHTRAAVFLENADAEFDSARLSALLGGTYNRLEAYDSAISKYKTALMLGDSTINVIYGLLNCYIFEDQLENAFNTGLLGIKTHPKKALFYYYPAGVLFNAGKYEDLRALAVDGRQHIPNSSKIESYYIVATYLINQPLLADSLFVDFIERYKYNPNELIESAKLYRQSLDREDLALRLESADLITTNPDLVGFFFYYNIYLEKGPIDSAEILLKIWLDTDPDDEQELIINELFERDFGKSQQ